MKIDRKTLHLVFPVDRLDGSTVHVHSTPIGRETFEANYKIISRAYSNLISNRTFVPRIAALALRDAGEAVARENRIGREAGDGGYAALMAEIERLTSVVVPNGHGWLPLPLEVATARNMVDEEDVAEIRGAVAFFILGWHMAGQKDRKDWAQGTAESLGGQTTLSNSTDFANSLPTSMPDVSSGEKTEVSSPTP